MLKKAGIVSARRRGMKVFSRLENPGILRAFACAAAVIRKATARRKGVI